MRSVTSAPQAHDAWRDLVRTHFPGAPDDLCDYILWNETAFPIGGRTGVDAELFAFAAANPVDITRALEFDDGTWQEWHRLYPDGQEYGPIRYRHNGGRGEPIPE